MVGEAIEKIIENKIFEILNNSKNVEMPDDIIETDNIGEVIEKLAILHCRMWYLEDSIGLTNSDTEIADLKRKIDICFKVKRPRYVEAINRMLDNSIINGKTLVEDSVKLYNGFKENQDVTCYCGRPIDSSSPDCMTFNLCKDHVDNDKKNKKNGK